MYLVCRGGVNETLLSNSLLGFPVNQLGMFPKRGSSSLIVGHVLQSPGVGIMSSLAQIIHIIDTTYVTTQNITHIISTALSTLPSPMFAYNEVITAASFGFVRVGPLKSVANFYSPLFFNFYFLWARGFRYPSQVLTARNVIFAV